MTYCNCEQDLDLILCNIPFEFREGIVKALCVLIKSEKYDLCTEVKRCETVTALSPFSVQGSTISFSYTDEKGVVKAASFDILPLFNKTLDSLSVSCAATQEQWDAMSLTERVQALADECACPVSESLEGEWTSELPPCFVMTNFEGEWSNECTVPRNVVAVWTTSGYRVTFDPAVLPAPDNSYTVKRRLKSSPDVPASYTVVGSPSFNISTGSWEIFDTSSIPNNVKYVYSVTTDCDIPATAYAEIMFCEVVSNLSAAQVTEGVQLTFNLRTAPPELGFRVKYREVGTTAYTTSVFTPDVVSSTTIYITINVNPTTEWEGTIESFCEEGVYSETIFWTTNF